MDLMTIKEIARELEVPESNLRYYRDRFEDFLPSVGQGRKRRYKKEALDVFKYIVQGFQNDKTTEQIAEELPKHFPRKPDVTDQEDNTSQILLPRSGEDTQTSVYQLLHNQAKTLERFSRFLFSRREPSLAVETIQSDQRKLKKGVVLLNRDVQKLKSSLDNHQPLSEKYASLEQETARLRQELAETKSRLDALEAKSGAHHQELKSALQECLHLMRRILESEEEADR